MTIKTKLAIFVVLVVAASASVCAATPEEKAAFRTFDGGWSIKEGPLAGFSVLIGKHGFSSQPFVLLGPGSGTALRIGKIKGRKVNDKLLSEFGGKIKGTFKAGFIPKGDFDPASDLGLAQTGKFDFEITPDSLYKFAGNITGKDGVSFSVSAEAGDLTFQNAKFVLEIEPTKRKIFKVGDAVTFDITAELRGPAGVTPTQPELQVAFDQSVSEISVDAVSNITACDVKTTRTPNQIACSFGLLGPRQTKARIKVTAIVPQALSGDRMIAAAAVDDVPGYNPEDQFHPIYPSAAVRKASVKIKKNSSISLPGACAQLPGKWIFDNAYQFTFQNDLNVDFEFNGDVQTGTWSCAANTNVGAANFVVTTAFPRAIFLSSFFLSNDGKTLTTFLFGTTPITGTKSS